MVTKTRSYKHSYDNRLFHQSNYGAWSNQGGSVESHDSSVTADYPERDYRRLIREGDNATTKLDGVSSGFRTRPVSGAIKDILQRPKLDPSEDGVFDYEVIYWSRATPTIVSQQRLRGATWRQGLVVPSDTSLLSTVDNQALMGFNKKVLKLQRDLQGIVSIGELGESLRMIRSPVRSLRNGVDNYLTALRRRGRGIIERSPRVIAGVAADTWLEYSFGWRPLVNDIKAGAEALANSLHHRPPRQFVSFTAYGRKTVAGQAGGNLGTVGNFSLARTKEVRDHYVGVKYYGVVGMPPNEDGFDQSRFGVTWSEIIPSIWELIPYSFLVDYFTNVGDIIGSFSSLYADVKWVAKGTSIVNESSWSTVTVVPSFSANIDWKLIRQNPGSKCYKISRTISRDTYSGSRIPRLEFSIPGMGLKWLNIAALGLSSRRAEFALRGR